MISESLAPWRLMASWLDESFEAASPRRVVLARRILANLEPQDVEAGFALDFFKCVGHAGVGLTELPSDTGQPWLDQITTVFDPASVLVEDPQSIGGCDDLGVPMELTAGVFRVASWPGGKVGPEMRFESMQGDVGQKGRQWSRNSAHLHGSHRACFTIPLPKRSVRVSSHFAFHHCRRLWSPNVGVCTWQGRQRSSALSMVSFPP
jgi:hypothetical protein